MLVQLTDSREKEAEVENMSSDLVARTGLHDAKQEIALKTKAALVSLVQGWRIQSSYKPPISGCDALIPNSRLSNLLKTCARLDPSKRATALEDDIELESAYRNVALQGESEVLANPEDEVDFHYVCFVKIHEDDRLYELDGHRKGPFHRGLFTGNDILSEDGLGVTQKLIEPVARGVGFSLLWYKYNRAESARY
ncbi:uncharacterized protein BCR38DRAFT_479542 [Pseudomassariella vexata]|uniref:ubiquitinyl hydrolase 1 n=1 Tax=Pseudomassariella vexata TaxID=1141098 RepID=A0A1Y2EHH6_9PEZI|nr:uncharacterized protein BCR38DRAFT_479542 [Pseudomassariella vexata]ORY71013.1 hypothetical protein BCR38DRAFT_479542 [Pseudomassariella vexata]